MKILVSNDDGYNSAGIQALAEALREVGEVTVVAPALNRSGASNSLTLDRPLCVKQAANGYFYIDGTPTDCVHVALTGLLKELPDLICSGINDGPNLGDDTLYSGTVAAAMEGYLFGIPAFAFSQAERGFAHVDAAAQVAVDLVKRWMKTPTVEPVLLNVNIPCVPYAELNGMHVTRLGKRHAAEPVIRASNAAGEEVYWIGPAGGAKDAGPETDFHALTQGAVSMTPLRVDLTRRSQLDLVKQWIASPL